MIGAAGWVNRLGIVFRSVSRGLLWRLDFLLLECDFVSDKRSHRGVMYRAHNLSLLCVIPLIFRPLYCFAYFNEMIFIIYNKSKLAWINVHSKFKLVKVSEILNFSSVITDFLSDAVVLTKIQWIFTKSQRHWFRFSVLAGLLMDFDSCTAAILRPWKNLPRDFVGLS